jgi:hypothetical protein
VVLEFLLAFRQVCDSNQAQEPYFVNIAACIDSYKKVCSQGGDSLLDLNVKPAEIHVFE